MQLTLSVVASALAVANAAVIGREAAALEVTLTPVNAAGQVTATVKNVGAENLNLLTLGTLFDAAPVQKLNVVDESSAPVEFKGLLRSVQRTGVEAQHFKSLKAGETFTTTIDAASVHDLTSATYTMNAEGAIPYAIGESTEIEAAVPFRSNDISMKIEEAEAKAIEKAIPAKSLVGRTALQSDCTSTRRTSTLNALSRCASLARAAATAATSGSSSKFSEYFKTTSSSTRSTVAARLNAVASQCSSTTSGNTAYYCTDVYGYCESNVLAYTIPSQNVIVNCPLYYSALPALTSSCHAQDQTTTTLHEMTHAPGVYSPGTQDNGYGYSAATALSSARAVLNADSYALYANAIYVGC